MFFGNVPRKDNVTCHRFTFGRADCFVIEPTALARQDQLWKLDVSRRAAQERVCFDKSNQILARLDRTKRENVIALDAVSLSNSFQFGSLHYRKESLRRSLGRDRDSPGRNLVRIADVLSRILRNRNNLCG